MTRAEKNDETIAKTEKKTTPRNKSSSRIKTGFRRFRQKTQRNVAGELNQAENAERPIQTRSSKLRKVAQKPVSKKWPADVAEIVPENTPRSFIRPNGYKFYKLGRTR